MLHGTTRISKHEKLWLDENVGDGVFADAIVIDLKINGVN
jgi:hypothetical protein